MSLILVSPPAVEPLSAADVRERLGVDSDVTDATLNALVSAARLNLERRFGLALITQTLDYFIDRFPGSYRSSPDDRGYRSFGRCDLRSVPVGQSDIVIPFSPVQTVTSVTYFDATGASQAVDSSTYLATVGDLQLRLALKTGNAWPDTLYASNAVQVRLIAGFGDTADKVPETLKTAVLLSVSHLRSLTARNLFESSVGVPGIIETRYVVGTGSTDVIDAAVASLMQDYVRPSL